jgi:hypothetical protein
LGQHAVSIKLHEHGHERVLGKRDEIIIIIIIRNGAKTKSLQTLFGRLNKYVKQRVKQGVIIPYNERLCASLVLILNNLKWLPILLHVFRSLFCIKNMIIKPGLMGEPVLPSFLL